MRPIDRLLAIMERRRTGRGQHVEGSLLATAITFANPTLIEQAVLAPNRVPTGNRGQLSAPTDIFATRDGFVLTQVVGQPLFARWARLMGEKHWLEDPRFANDTLRGKHGHLVSERMARWCAERSTDEAIAALGEARIPCGPVLSPQQALDHPQVHALDLLQPQVRDGLPRPAPVARVPVNLSEAERAPGTPAPRTGADTDAILAELGFDAAAIADLRQRAVV